jgi:GrpB-like predicted nucleotidyltransferase (UPF0157 family)
MSVELPHTQAESVPSPVGMDCVSEPTEADRATMGECDPRTAVAQTPHNRARAGAGEGPIEIVEYDLSWRTSYDAERERLAPLLPGVRIHHIGSTAVPGLAGKAVIDMIALVDDLDANSAALIQRAGYQLPTRFNVDLVHRRFLCYPTAAYRTHHLHLVDEREDMDRCLRFRNDLRVNPQLAAEYVALKRALAARFLEDREGYTTAKSRFIEGADSSGASRDVAP